MATGKRELIDTGTDKRYVRRDEKGKFDEVVDVGGRFHRTANATPSMRASQGMVTAATGNAEDTVRRLAYERPEAHHWARRSAFASAPDR